MKELFRKRSAAELFRKSYAWGGAPMEETTLLHLEETRPPPPCWLPLRNKGSRLIHIASQYPKAFLRSFLGNHARDG